MFDQACKRIDYRLTKSKEDEDVDDNVMDELFFKEGKIFDFKESLAMCTDTYLNQLSELEDEDEESRTILTSTFKEHSEKVEMMINKLVCR